MSNDDMITDRTQSDVDKSLQIRDNKVKTFQTLTDDEIAILERGMLTINTINRIEEKQAELKNLINGLGYWNTQIYNKTDWAVIDVFTEADFQRIIDNENALRNAFFTYADTPNTPALSFHYNDINDLEKILVDLDVMINDVKSNYRECGNFSCGEE